MAVDGKALARLAQDLTELADPGEAKVVVSQAGLGRVARRQA
jgi:hypothetical protein